MSRNSPAAWLAANPKQQGKRTDLTPPDEGETVTAANEAPADVLADEILQRLYRSYGAKDVHTMTAAQKLLRAYRAAVLQETADRYQSIMDNDPNPDADPRYWTGIRDMIAGLRNIAAEDPQDEEE